MTEHPAHIHIVTSIEEEASGPSYSVTRLAAAQAALGLSVGVYSLAASPSKACREGVVYRTFTRSSPKLPGLSRLEYSQDLARALTQAAKQGALLHVHGLWRMPNVYPGQAARRHRTALVLSPRGMLGRAALDYSPTQKRLFWHLAQKAATAPVTCYHATSEAELQDIREFGLAAPVAIAPNGIDLPDLAPPAPRAREVLHLGRIHPKKAIDRLLKAWAMLAAEAPEWRLRIVGPSEGGYVDELERNALDLGISDRVSFDGPVYGDEKQSAYRRAAVFVLPTRHENFGMVVAEALGQETPVICTTGAPWQGLESENCGWWVDQTPEAIASALRDVMQRDPADLQAMGARGRDWMRRDFGWPGIAQKTAELYAWCRQEQPQPEFVYT